jgi:hypothetical protein
MRSTIRSLAVEAKLSVRACRERLRESGLQVAVGGQWLQGEELAHARAAPGLPKRRRREQAAPSRPPIGESEMIVRMLRPLRQKGKLGRLHTTPIEHVCGHGVPDHLKAEAKAQAEQLLDKGVPVAEGEPGAAPRMADAARLVPAGGSRAGHRKPLSK